MNPVKVPIQSGPTHQRPTRSSSAGGSGTDYLLLPENGVVKFHILYCEFPKKRSGSTSRVATCPAKIGRQLARACRGEGAGRQIGPSSVCRQFADAAILVFRGTIVPPKKRMLRKEVILHDD